MTFTEEHEQVQKIHRMQQEIADCKALIQILLDRTKRQDEDIRRLFLGHTNL